jgi:hypothetical protein
MESMATRSEPILNSMVGRYGCPPAKEVRHPTISA